LTVSSQRRQPHRIQLCHLLVQSTNKLPSADGDCKVIIDLITHQSGAEDHGATMGGSWQSIAI